MRNYGFPLIGLSLTMFVLNISDRYIILYLHSKEASGIYAANYSLASAAYIMIMMGIMRAVYPNVLSTWSKNDVKKTKELLSGGVRYYLLISIPATVGLVTLSKPISQILLSRPEYHDGYTVIGWTAIGMLLFGLTEYCNKAWELTSNTKVILRNSLISGLINIALNIIFIPIYGYEVAAITTTISFAIYFILSYLGARNILIWTINLSCITRIIMSALAFGVLLIIVQNYYEITVVLLVVCVIISMLLYVILLLITGELKEETKLLKKRIKG
jgi:O-antigen/teichoic acid export membrane protein